MYQSDMYRSIARKDPTRKKNVSYHFSHMTEQKNMTANEMNINMTKSTSAIYHD
jgi:hypothetical protein